MARKFALVERDEEEESSSDDGSDPESEEEEPAVQPEPRKPPAQSRAAQQVLKIKIGNKGDAPGCKVCGAKDHRAGFVGATYMDCPNKPCYLCKLPGHTTAACPFKSMQGHGCDPDRQTSGGKGGSSKNSLLSALRGRETGQGLSGGVRSGGGGSGSLSAVRDAPEVSQRAQKRYQIDAAIYKLHTRRCCSLEFHPHYDSIIISGDKKGGIAVWDFDKVHERTIYNDVHNCLCNQIKMLPWLDSMSCCTTSSDGTVKLVDLDTGSSRALCNLNPQGWTEGGPWSMVYGCASDASKGVVYAGDSDGFLHMLDPRANGGGRRSAQVHKDKLVSVDVHPLDSNLVLTAGNDRSAKLFDIRAFSWGSSSGGGDGTGCSTSGQQAVAPAPAGRGAGGRKGGSAPPMPGELASMIHSKVVNSAYFSPITGRKILTTCQDNRIRVWDSLLDASGPPSREIVHSHDFNRYLTPFRAEWDPKDSMECRFIVGRYISEDYSGKALHPIDIMDANSGRLLRELVDTNLTTITPVNKMHPRRDVIVSGSSRSLYLWCPRDGEPEDEADASGVSAGAAGIAAPSERPGSTLPGASSKFVFFDVDPDVKKSAAGGRKKPNTAAGRKRKPGSQADDDDDD